MGLGFSYSYGPPSEKGLTRLSPYNEYRNRPIQGRYVSQYCDGAIYSGEHFDPCDVVSREPLRVHEAGLNGPLLLSRRALLIFWFCRMLPVLGVTPSLPQLWL